MIGAGVLIGTSLACTAAAIAHVGGGARGAGGGAQHRARHRLGGGIARRAALRADRAGAERGLWLADGLVGFVILSLGCCRRPGSPAASTGYRCRSLRRMRSATPRRGGGEDRVRQRVLRGDDLRLFRLRHAARLHHHASAVLSRDLRHGSDAERADARRHRRLQRARQPVLRLGRPALEQAGAAGRDLYLALAGARPGTSCCRRRPRRRWCSAR